MISIDSIVQKIREQVVAKETSVGQRYLASSYYEKRIEVLRQAEGIVIAGAGVYGRHLYEMLELEGIASKVLCFCDNSIELQGTDIHSVPVLPMDEATGRHENALFVITPRYYENELLQQLYGLGVSVGGMMIFTFDYTGLVD